MWFIENQEGKQYTHHGSFKSRREREKGVRNLFKEIIAENFQIMGGIWTSGSWSSKVCTQFQPKYYTKKHYNHILQSQRENFENSERKATCHIQGNTHKIIIDFSAEIL